MIPFASTRPKPDITKLNPDSVLELHRMARCPTGIHRGGSGHFGSQPPQRW